MILIIRIVPILCGMLVKIKTKHFVVSVQLHRYDDILHKKRGNPTKAADVCTIEPVK